MSTLPLSRLLVVSLLGLGLTASASAASTSNIESLGDNTFSITRTATSGFDRDVGKFRTEAQQDAVKYGADNNKVIKILSVTSDRPHFGGGFAWAKVLFKALAAGDAELTAVKATPPANPTEQVAPTGVLPTYPGDFYAELLKLDDLRKRGLLTDKEFELQKKKLIKNSK